MNSLDCSMSQSSSRGPFDKINQEGSVESIISGMHEVSTSTSSTGESEEGYNSQEEFPAGHLTNLTSDPEAMDLTQIEDLEEKTCWVCFANEADEPSAEWIHPCRCRGTTKWVHQACIQRWIDEKQKGNSTAQVECPQCGMTYLIQFPTAGRLVSFLETSDKLIQRLCPIIAGGVCVGSLYWTCITFGAVTIMQTVGHDEGLMLMECADPLFLLVSLPLVPVGLVLGKMIRWEDAVLRFLRNVVPKTFILKKVLPIFAESPEKPVLQSWLPPLSDHISVTRTFCGALFFPSIASFLGKSLFEQVPSQLHRTILGGLTFVAIKGILKIYYKQHAYVRQCHRTILNYEEY